MYYDQVRNAYIDAESGEVVLQEEGGIELSDIYYSENDRITETRAERAPVIPMATIARPSNLYSPLSKKRGIAPSPEENHANLEQELYDLHASGVDTVDATAVNVHHGMWDDWSMARALQALEFEIPNEMLEEDDEDADFRAKEVYASKSCKRQMLTLSTFIVVVQIALLVAMIQVDGYDKGNSVIGPPVYSMVRFGAKEAGLIVYKNEWWRLLSSIMLHGGILHIIPNGAIQLRVGGYLNMIYGTPKWLFIYLISGIFGEMMSCIFLPGTVGVGSSGAVLGMLASWVVWIIFRWKKIPHACKSQRNCQLFIVVASVVVTLATSFQPNVDWAAHIGGAIQGILWGIVLLSSELDHERNQLWLRIAAGSVACALIGYSLYYIAVPLHPTKENFDYFDQNDDWGR
eukprot:gene21264-24131_t